MAHTSSSPTPSPSPPSPPPQAGSRVDGQGESISAGCTLTTTSIHDSRPSSAESLHPPPPGRQYRSDKSKSRTGHQQHPRPENGAIGAAMVIADDDANDGRAVGADAAAATSASDSIATRECVTSDCSPHQDPVPQGDPENNCAQQTAVMESSDSASARVVRRPIPAAQRENPRQFQLAQIRRRFSPQKEEEENGSHGGTRLVLTMKPSDPDFPYDINALHCVLLVPVGYPTDGKPSIRVTNQEMERGYQINVERGFDAIVAGAPNATLLTYFNHLDRQLEVLLSAQKADTIKIVPNVRRSVRAEAVDAVVVPSGSSSATASTTATTTKKATAKDYQPENHSLRNATYISTTPKAKSIPIVHSIEQKAAAEAKRSADIRQLEARLGRLPQYSKSSDGIVYTLPLDPRKRPELPIAMQAVKLVKLVVPLLYNLVPCRIELQGISREDCTTVERAFEEKVLQNPNLSLINHLNYLAQNMHAMARQKQQKLKPVPALPQVTAASDKQAAPEKHTITPPASNVDPDRPHLITIPRPPEWTVREIGDGDSDGDSSDEEDDDSLSEDTGNDEDAATLEGTAGSSSKTSEKGVLISFPLLELYGIELLQIFSLNVTVKCSRCKTPNDISSIKPYIPTTDGSSTSGLRSESCKKCANSLVIGYRAELMHMNSVRAGYLDLDGCTVADLLPSNFIPTCSECSTPYPSPGVVSVRGDVSMAFCRNCHRKMTLRIPDVRFLLISASDIRASRVPARKKAKEKLGIVAGQELPNRGLCKDYRKSYRWFRFSCCDKVFACDRCHDEQSNHAHEHANRMICGYCSKEQNFRPQDCAFCHNSLIKRSSSGFWEAGKGTRDRSKMSRKDPRKYKRRGPA